MTETYISAIWRFAMRGFVLRTDAMQIILASAIPAFFHILGIPMPTDAATAVLAYIGYAAGALVGIRFIFAPYFVWKEQNEIILDLEAKLDEPKRIQERITAEHMTKLKLEISEIIGRLTSFALNHGTPNKSVQFWDNLQNDIDSAKAKVEQLSHDGVLWNLCNDTIQLLSIVISDKTRHTTNQEDRNNLSGISKKTLKILQSP